MVKCLSIRTNISTSVLNHLFPSLSLLAFTWGQSIWSSTNPLEQGRSDPSPGPRRVSLPTYQVDNPFWASTCSARQGRKPGWIVAPRTGFWQPCFGGPAARWAELGEGLLRRQVTNVWDKVSVSGKAEWREWKWEGLNLQLKKGCFTCSCSFYLRTLIIYCIFFHLWKIFTKRLRLIECDTYFLWI